MSHSDSSAIRKPKKSRISCCFTSKQTAPAFALGAVRVNALRLFSLFVLTFILLLGSGAHRSGLDLDPVLGFHPVLGLDLVRAADAVFAAQSLALGFFRLPCVDLLV